MQILAQPSTPRFSLRQVRAQSFALTLAQAGGLLVLDAYRYRALHGAGWSRSAVEHAIDDLVSEGRAYIIPSGGPLEVRSLDLSA